MGSRCSQIGGSLEFSWGPLSFALQIVVKLICVCLCLVDAIVELHAMVEKTFNNLFQKVKLFFIIIKGVLSSYCICSGANYHTKVKSLVQIHESIL